MVSKSNKHKMKMVDKVEVAQNIAAGHHISHTTTGISGAIPPKARYEANITLPPIQPLIVKRERQHMEEHVAAAIEEWGLTNPNTIRSMLTRRRRLKRLARQKESNRTSPLEKPKYQYMKTR